MTPRTVVITGAGRGIGRALAVRFAQAGDRVVLAARSAAELVETKQLVESAGGTACAVPTDVAVPAQVEALIERARQFGSTVDVLVNCAALGTKATIAELGAEAYRQLQAVNVDAVYFASRAVWPIMEAQGGGVIVSISSVASADPFPGLGAYGATKAWVNAWTRALAGEGKEAGIRAFAVAPGAVETQMLRTAFPDFPAEATLAPADVAELVYTLTLPACQYVTGQTIFVRK